MIGLPHRVGAAYVVLGQENGTEPRFGHILNGKVYGGGSAAQYHTYYGNYPTTTPDKVITKVRGTLGEDYTYTSPTVNSIPGNFIYIASYKTELNHFLPTAAESADTNLPTYSSQPLLAAIPPPLPPNSSGYAIGGDFWGGESVYINEQLVSLITAIKESYEIIDTVTDVLDAPSGSFVPAKFYPRWTEEAAFSQFGNMNYPIEVTPPAESTDYQTREGPANTAPASQVPLYWICPWTVARIGTGLGQLVNIDASYSYKFTKAGTHAAGSVAEKIVYPWGKTDPNTSAEPANNFLADECAWQYEYDAYAGGNTLTKYAAGGYRTVPCVVWPKLEGETYPYVNYENKSTHGLFLAADGSCWNIGTEIKVKVYIWKAPPKLCLYYRNKVDNPWGNDGYPYTNWKWSEYPSASPPTPDYTTFYAGLIPNPQRPLAPGTGSLNDNTFQFEGGLYTGVDYSIAEPKAPNLHYWGTVFTMDTDSEECGEIEVREFTITVGDDNTYKCDGTPRSGVTMSQFGFKVADIELPVLEGYITFINDFEVISVKKPPVTP